MTPAAARFSSIVCACLWLALAGCSPLRVSFDIGFAPPPGLAEREVMRDPAAGRASPKIALIPITGAIADVKTPGLLGTRPNPVDRLVQRLDAAANDRDVRAVILRINSPGGAVTGSDIMHREIRRFRERTGKPVIASMGEIAASGGYYVALAADHIIAEPTTITGSIGVIIQTVNVSGGLAKLGVTARAVTSGPNKDLANPLTPMRDEHYAILKGMVDEFHARFRDLVIERRDSLRDDAMDNATDGRIVTGAQAASMGLVDAVGGLRDAIDEAKARASLLNARLIAYVDADAFPGSPYAVRAGDDRAGALPAQLNLLQINTPSDLALLDSAGFYYLWTPSAY